MHLTLRFLGNTPASKLDDLGSALDRLAAQHAPFNLLLGALGCFPNERRPRVIWVGLQGQLQPLQTLRSALEDILQPLGWDPEDKPFHPHLTLGRVKDKSAAVDLPWGQGVAPAEIRVRELLLYESQLRPQGPRYIVQHSSPLAV
jgi:2'-5' RNA ligase